MHLLFRETFATSGHLDQANPGANFSLVRGVFHQRAGGPRLPGTVASSADLRTDALTPLASVRFPPEQGIRVFICGWYFFKSLQDHNARLLAVTAPTGDSGPTISVEHNGLAAGVEYLTKTPFPRSVLNRWIFLGIAVAHDAGGVGSVRFYAKFPGEPMQSWTGFDHGTLGVSSIGGLDFGVNTSNSGIRCRLGAPAAYRFDNSDFSDVTYPADLLEPETKRTWYCNPETGNDANDGTAPDRAWASLDKINEESLHTGLFPADSWEEGDTLIIDTGGASLDAKGKALHLATEGLNLRAAEGNEWIDLKSHRSLPGNRWESTDLPNVYSTSDTEADIVVWEDDKFLHHPTGTNLAAVSASLSTTPGSFWTDGVRLYLHPFGSTDPRTDGKRYERSHRIAKGAAVALGAPNLHVRDLRAGKTCLAGAADNDAIGAYCLSFTAAPGKTQVSHCYFYYGSKHNVGIVQGDFGDDLLLEDVQCEQGSPYTWAGGQTLFVSYNHRPLDLGIIHRFHRCRSRANAGKIGSTEGTMTSYYPLFYSHNMGAPGELKQFARFEFIDCDFGAGPVSGSAVKDVVISNSTVGIVAFAGDVLLERSRVLGTLTSLAGTTVTARNSLFRLAGMLTANRVSGTLDLQGCVFDGSGITSIQGGVLEAAFFVRDAPLTLVFRNNVVILPKTPVLAHFFSLLRQTDDLDLSHNAYLLGANGLVYSYDDGNSASNHSLATWQAMGFDANSFSCEDPQWIDYRPQPGSPLIDAGAELSPAEDFTGIRLLRRNDIGAFEGPPSRFDEWQFANLSEEERNDTLRGGPTGSLVGDGVSNLLKYAMGIPARTPFHEGGFRMTATAGQDGIEFPRSLFPRDLEWMLEASGDLVSWRDHPELPWEITRTEPQAEWLRIHLPMPTDNDDPRFFRLKVRQTESP